MIRITGGRWKGRNVYCPKGDAVRPTTAFVRESLFSILGHRVPEARLLDLFAGSGVVGFEALSRGAHFVMAVEAKAAHVRLLQKSCTGLHLTQKDYQITQSDVFDWLKNMKAPWPESQRFDIIYLDPPYAYEQAEQVVCLIFERQLLALQGLVVWETACKTPNLPSTIEVLDQRKYGRSNLFFLRFPCPESPVEIPVPSEN